MHPGAITSSVTHMNLRAKSFSLDFSRRKMRPRIELAENKQTKKKMHNTRFEYRSVKCVYLLTSTTKIFGDVEQILTKHRHSIQRCYESEGGEGVRNKVGSLSKAGQYKTTPPGFSAVEGTRVLGSC